MYDNKNLYIYTRVSTQQQANENKNSLSSQYEECLDYIKNNINKTKKYIEKYVSHYCDIGSTYNKKNILTERNKLIKTIENNSLILIYDISRIGRDTFDTIKFLEKIKQKNIQIISVSDNLIYNKCKIMDKDFYHSVIESEKNSDKKSISIKNKINDMKNKGSHIGKPPYGYYTIKINGIKILKEDLHEQEIMKLILKKIRYFKKNNKNPFSLTSEYLNQQNIKYKDKKWTRQYVNYVYTVSFKINHNFNQLKL